jgi:3-phosphoshikimate 1-carboxyvinyltransferase
MTMYSVQPGEALQGELDIPGDKSISHRALILSAIAQGASHISHCLLGEDCLATANALQALGVNITRQSSQLTIEGVGLTGFTAPTAALDLGNSGTAIRLLAGLLAGQPFASTLVGDASLMQRPMGRITQPLRLMGANISDSDGKPPLAIAPTTQLQAIDYRMPVASAQVKSCLLLASLYAKGTTRVYQPGIARDHTERMLTAMGCQVHQSEQYSAVDGGQILNPIIIDVPGDISSAAFFMVAASINPGSQLLLRRVGVNPSRIGVLNILQAMGANIRLLDQRQLGAEPVADMLITAAPLTGIEIPLAWVPLAIDEFPAIFIAAAVARGRTILRGAQELRVKESDRIAVMVAGLQQLSIHAQALPDGVIIEGGQFTGGEIDSGGDHRIAMAFSMAATVAKAPVRILDCANVATSFPDFVACAQAVGIDIFDNDEVIT